MNFARLFSDIRKITGLTQIQMAARLRITQGAYSKIENGKQKPGAKTLVHLWRSLDQRHYSEPHGAAFGYLVGWMHKGVKRP